MCRRGSPRDVFLFHVACNPKEHHYKVRNTSTYFPYSVLYVYVARSVVLPLPHGLCLLSLPLSSSPALISCFHAFIIVAFVSVRSFCLSFFLVCLLSFFVRHLSIFPNSPRSFVHSIYLALFSLSLSLSPLSFFRSFYLCCLSFFFVRYTYAH